MPNTDSPENKIPSFDYSNFASDVTMTERVTQAWDGYTPEQQIALFTASSGALAHILLILPDEILATLLLVLTMSATSLEMKARETGAATDAETARFAYLAYGAARLEATNRKEDVEKNAPKVEATDDEIVAKLEQLLKNMD